MNNESSRESNTASDVLTDIGSTPQRKLWSIGTLTYTTGGLVILFSWLLWGDFAWSMRDRSVAQTLTVLLKHYNASDKIIGTLLGSLPAIILIFVSPIISYHSDRHRGRWGRRIPFILVATPIAALSMVGLAYSIPLAGLLDHVLGVHSPGTEDLCIIVLGVFWTCFEIAAVATGGLFFALVNDVVPSHFVGRFYGLFRALSLIAGMVFNQWLIGQTLIHYSWLFGGIAAIYGGGVMLMCFMVKEGNYPPPPDVKPGERKSLLAALKIYFRECFSKPYYLWVFLSLTLAAMCISVVNLFTWPFARSVHMSVALYGHYIAISYGVSLILSYFIGWLVDRFHPLRMGIFALVLYTFTVLWGSIYATTAETFAIALVAHTVISGIYFTSTASLPQRLFPQATFAQFYSANDVLIAIFRIVLSPLFGLVLDLSGHQYRYSFLMSFIMTLCALVAMLVVHARFMRLGGPSSYVAPE